MEITLNTEQLIFAVFNRRCASIARHWTRLWGRRVTPRWVQKQMSADDLQKNFYGKTLKWLYSIEAATYEGSRLIVMDILARFPLLTEGERRRLSLTDFLDNLSKLFGEIIGLAVAGKRGELKVKVLETKLLCETMAMNL